MNSKLRDLLPAIVSRVIERGSFVSKTKLLKLLYLFDLEWYRIHRETYTGFDWIFHLLGPWTREYDNVLDTFYANEFLQKKSGNDSYDTEFIVADEQIPLHRLFETRDDERILEDLIRTWATVPTPEILDYVYFRTEPMDQAERGELLDFNKVSEQRPLKYSRPPSGRSSEEIEAFKTKVSERVNQVRREPKASINFTPPKYDDEFFEAMDKLESMK